MLERFGKSFKDILDLKTSFFDENERFLRRALDYARLYVAQPRRLNCKLCNARLPESPSFVKHGIPYAVCGCCTHLNGMHEDTDEFCKAVYTSDGGKEYAENYGAAEIDAYRLRRDRIYVPKARFLADALRENGEDPARLRYADMGAGAGYFVAAMNEIGIDDISGFEVGKAQVDLGNHMLPGEPLRLVELGDTIRLCGEVPADVISFIGVFEHLQAPRAVLEAVRKNERVRFIYFCVPLFGPCIFSEMVFPEVMPRQLAVGHTHLFTDGSLRSMEQEFGFERVGAWWFGTDMMDYYRSVLVTLRKHPEQAPMADHWQSLFTSLVDDVQLALDRQRKCGQVHMVLRVRHR